MTIKTCIQRTNEWYELRRGMPTCSRFGAIITPQTEKPSAAQNRLINELIAESIIPPEQGFLKAQYISPEMEEGMKLEAESRCAYELEYATEPVKEVGFIIHESGLFGGSPDALVGESGGVEIKCPSPVTHIGYIRAGSLPLEYKCQVHGYLIVTGRAWWDFFSYSRNLPPLYLRIHRDDFTEKLADELSRFCQKYNAARAKFGLMTVPINP